MNIAHFDLKLDNILVNVGSNGIITDLCISDFGLSRSFSDFKKSIDFDGTWIYMAPEMYENDQIFDEKIDCWSLGVILYTLLKLEFPFGGDSLPVIYNQIKNFKLKINP